MILTLLFIGALVVAGKALFSPNDWGRPPKK